MHCQRGAVSCASNNLQGPTTEEGPGAVKRRERLRGEGAELSWLMRTTYIANDMEERRQQKNAEKSGTADTEGETFDRDAQIATIEVGVWSLPLQTLPASYPWTLCF